MADYDVITIGAGPTGLMASTWLAKDGYRVACLEMNDHVGGLASNAHEWPGFTHNRGAWYVMFAKLDMLWKTLELDKYGVELLDPPTVGCVLPLPGEKPFLMYADPKQQMEHIQENFGAEAVQGFVNLLMFMSHFTNGLEASMSNPPISIGQMMDAMPSIEAKDALRQIFYGNITVLLDRFFPDKKKYGAIRGFMAVQAVDGFFGGPMTPGSAMTLAYHIGTPSEAASGGGQFKLVKGHIGKLCEGIAESFKDKGGTLQLNSQVKRILIEKGAAIGVELLNGDKITADTVISSGDAYNTFIRMIAPGDIEPYLEKQVRNINYRDHFIQIYLKLKGLPEYRDEYKELNEGKWRWNTWCYPSLELLEEAWDDCKHGRIAEEPCPAVYIPSINDPSLAPEGYYSGTIFALSSWPVGPVPANKIEGMKNEIAERIFSIFKRYMPNFRDVVEDFKVWAPQDYEAHYHNTGGTWTHGMIQLDQMFDFRPVVGMSQYRTPIKNLYLCGTSTHPGPGITGYNPMNCLKVIKEDWKKQKRSK